MTNPIIIRLLARRKATPEPGANTMLYDIFRQQAAATSPNAFSPIFRILGQGQVFEAVVRLGRDDESGQWEGELIFKDTRFSPCNFPAVQLKYRTPGSCSGVLAELRAEQFWRDLTGIFVNLMTSGDGISK